MYVHGGWCLGHHQMLWSVFCPLPRPPQPEAEFQTGKQRGRLSLGGVGGVVGALAQEQGPWERQDTEQNRKEQTECMCVCACVYVRVGLQADKLAARHGLCSAFVCTCNAIICIAIVCSILSLSGCLCIIILLLLASLLLSQRAKGIITQ